MGLHPFRVEVREDFEAVRLPLDLAEFHTYACDWSSDRVDYLVDGTLVRRVQGPPRYPLQLMLAVFDFPDRSVGGDDELVPELVVDWVQLPGHPEDSDGRVIRLAEVRRQQLVLALEGTLVESGWALAGNDRRRGGSVPMSGGCRGDHGMRAVPDDVRVSDVGSPVRMLLGVVAPHAVALPLSALVAPPAAWSTTWSMCWIGASHHGVRQMPSRGRGTVAVRLRTPVVPSPSRPAFRLRGGCRGAAATARPVRVVPRVDPSQRSGHEVTGPAGRYRAIARDVRRSCVPGQGVRSVMTSWISTGAKAAS